MVVLVCMRVHRALDKYLYYTVASPFGELTIHYSSDYESVPRALTGQQRL
jgi:hypothetical protein